MKGSFPQKPIEYNKLLISNNVIRLTYNLLFGSI